jgi:hypothetical protein
MKIEFIPGFVHISTQPYIDEDGNLQYETLVNNNGVKTTNRIVRIIYK